ncbi:MAG TPA: ABC transporter permease [Acidobacteriota bacterium]|jgi:peptide/nickel transport system permease protein
MPTLISLRIARALLLLFLLSVAVFSLSRAMPGDIWTELQMEPGVSAERLQALRRSYQLDRSLPAQYAGWLSHVIRGDFGYSPVERRPVAPLVSAHLSRTLGLAVFTMTLTITLSLLLSIAFAPRKGQKRLLDAAFLPLVLSVPPVLTSLLVRWIKLNVSPVRHYEVDSMFWQLESYFWPSLALAVPLAAYMAKQLRREIRGILGLQYYITAESKGLQKSGLSVHLLRPLLPVLLNLSSVLFSSLIAGAVVAEAVFDFRGIGILALEAVLNRDTFLLMAALLAGCGLVIAVNLVTDLLVVWADPRLRKSTVP